MQVGSSTYPAQGFHESLPKGKASGKLTVTSTMLEFQTGDQRVSIPINGATFKLGGASDRLVFISHPNISDWSIYTSDRSILKDSHLQNVPSIKSQLNKARNQRFFNWSLLVAVVMIVVVTPIMLLANMDWVSGLIAEKIPPEWERSLGETTYAQYKIGKQTLQTEEGQQALQALTNPLLSAVASDRYDFQVEVINDQQVNAFALPGGFIVINAGLILEADSANEVLGVLAHEISHVTEQHGLRNVISTAGVFLVVDALLGDVSGVLAMLTNAAPLLINQSYSRHYEADADKKGLQLLERANIDPRGLISFFEKMIELEKEQLATIEDQDTRSLVEDAMAFLSTHPATQERIKNIESMIGDQSGPYQNYEDAFQTLKTQVQQFVAKHEGTQ